MVRRPIAPPRSAVAVAILGRLLIARDDRIEPVSEPGTRALGRGGGSEKCAHSLPSSVETGNGTWPVSRWVIMHPSE